MVEERQKIEKPVARRVRDGKVAKVIACFNQGYTDFDKIMEKTGASKSTVTVQYYKYKKEHGEPMNAALKAKKAKAAKAE